MAKLIIASIVFLFAFFSFAQNHSANDAFTKRDLIKAISRPNVRLTSAVGKSENHSVSKFKKNLDSIDCNIFASFSNPVVHIGGTDTIPADFPTPSLGFQWRVLDSNSNTIASNVNPNGWNVSPSNSLPLEITVSAPSGAQPGNDFRAECYQNIYGAPGNIFAAFDLDYGVGAGPPAPQNLTANAGDAVVHLQWGASPGATSYTIQRSNVSGSGFSNIATGVTSISWSDNSVTNNIPYYYRVRGVNGQSVGMPSNEASATPNSSAWNRYPLAVVRNPQKGLLPDALALPNWMGGLIPMDQSDAPIGGSSSAVSVSMPFGVTVINTGPDMVIRNPLGADVTFERTYRTSLAVANISSPGLPAGWTHNWDYRIVVDDEDDWSSIHLIYPNGASDTLVPVMSNNLPTGQFTVPTGCPYIFEGVPDQNSPGKWSSLYIKGSRSAKTIFTQLPEFDDYRLTKITDELGGDINVQYSGNIIQSINSSKTNFYQAQLLSFSYTNDLITYIYGNYVGPTNLSYANGRLTGVSSRVNGGSQWSYAYTDIDNVPFLTSTSTRTPNGNWQSTTIAHDVSTGRASILTDGNGVTRTLQYTNGKTEVQLEKSGSQSRSHAAFFDALGRTIKETDDAGYATEISYTSGKPSKISMIKRPGAGGEIAFAYDSHFNPTTINFPTGHTVSYTYEYSSDIIHGRPTSALIKDSSGVTTYSASTEYYSATDLITGALKGEVKEFTDNGYVSQYKYTGLGNIKSITSNGADGSPATTNYNYAATEKLGAPIKITDPLGRETHFTYNQNLSVASTTDPLGRQTVFTYNEYDEVIEAEDSTGKIFLEKLVGGKSPSKIKFLPAGTSNWLTLADLTYDNESSLIQSTSFGQTNNISATVDYALKSVTSSNNVAMHEFTVTPSTKKVSNRIGFGSGGTTWEHAFDISGNLAQVTTPMSNITTVVDELSGNLLSLDAENSLTTSGPTDFVNRTFAYDSDQRLLQANVTSAAQSNTSNYEYDYKGRLSKEKYTPFQNNSQQKVEYFYSTDDVLKYILITPSPGASVIKYEYFYNSLGWVTKIKGFKDSVAVPSLEANYEYDNGGRVKAVRTPVTTILYSYNNKDQITALYNCSADNAVDPNVPSQWRLQDPYNNSWHTIYSKFENIAYDNFGNRLAMSYAMRVDGGTQLNPIVLFDSGTINYGYTNQRLTSESYTRTGKPTITYTHNYDGTDNLTVLRGQSMTNNVQSDQLTSVPSFGTNSQVLYDLNGDMTKFRNLSTAFDPIQQLVTMDYYYPASGQGSGGSSPSLESANASQNAPGGSQPPLASYVFTYDHNGLRRYSQDLNTSNNNTEYGYSGSTLIWTKRPGIFLEEVGESQSSVEELTYYMTGPTGPILEYRIEDSPGKQVYGYNFDPQGSLVNRVANWITNYSVSGYGPRLYDGYGKQLWSDTDLDIWPYFPFKYKGQAGYISDNKTGLIYCWHRFYDPQLGRWISRDPIGLEGGVNTYAYCQGNPIAYVDPNGLDALTLFRLYWDFLPSDNQYKLAYMQDVYGIFRGYGTAIYDTLRSPWTMAEFAGTWAGNDLSIDFLGGAVNSMWTNFFSGLTCQRGATGFGESFGTVLITAATVGTGFAEGGAFTSSRFVTHWDTPNATLAILESGEFRAGTWVQTGKRTFWNKALSGTYYSRYTYPYSSYVTTLIPKEFLKIPAGGEFYKVLWGQRQIGKTFKPEKGFKF